jgi:heat shock protein HslJ
LIIHPYLKQIDPMKKIAITVMIAALLLAACAPKTTPTTLPAAIPENGNVPMVGTEWKLVELFGKPVEESDLKSAGFILLQKDGRFSASAGCNTILGSYDLKEPFAISFKSNMASTMMACPNLEKEDNFKKVLSETNAYQLSGNKLSFSKNKMAPFARFEAETKSK